MKPILDACCGSKMFWFDKNNDDVVFMDNWPRVKELCDGRKLIVDPDVIADFRNMPFEDESVFMVVFDPPHLIRAGEESWVRSKYSVLNADTWKDDIAKGFSECFRVLKPNGTLIFKWNEDQIKLSDVLSCTDEKPLFGNRRSKTHWIVFMKGIET